MNNLSNLERRFKKFKSEEDFSQTTVYDSVLVCIAEEIHHKFPVSRELENWPFQFLAGLRLP